MQRINLRDYYPFYSTDIYVDIPDEVAAALLEAQRLEQNYIRRMFWNKAQFSLDADDGIEHEAVFVSLSPAKYTSVKSRWNSFMPLSLRCLTSRASEFTHTLYWA